MNRGVLVLDACLAITFGNVGRLDLVAGLRAHRVVIAARAAAEVRRPPADQALRAAIASGEIVVEAVDLANGQEQQALAEYDARPAFRGRGEAEVLALAATRGYIVGSDEVPVLRTARNEFGTHRAASTLDLLIWAVREQRVTITEADSLLGQLDSGLGIRKQLNKRGIRLEDLI